MPAFLKQHYGDTEGPLGIPMLDQQAKALDELLSKLPTDKLHEPGHLTIEKATTELLPGERADVSWISTEDVDRMREVVRADGMNDVHFKRNPLVTFQHAYSLPPVGRSVWRKRARDGQRNGIKAKTVYPARPDDWPATAIWPPDFAFTLVENGLLQGKSIGFLPLRVRSPTDDEIASRPEYRNVWRIVEEWVLLEYACVFLPAQQNAVVEAVSKGLEIPEEYRRVMGLKSMERPIAFTPLEQIEKHVQRQMQRIDFEQLATRAFEDAWDRARGRV